MRPVAMAVLTLAVAVAVGLAVARGQNRDASPDDADIERGRYLVMKVAQCVQCHTPRDERGTLDERRLLSGARIPLGSPYPGLQWAFSAPRIAGLPGWSDDEAVALLTRGSRPNAPAPRAPMPKFQMTEEDARAVVAYLKSLR